MVNAIDDRDTVGNQGRNYKRRARAQVRGNDGCAAKLGFSSYDCARAINTDVCAHAHELARVHEAILEDVFRDDGSAGGLCDERHVLCLHVGGEAWIFPGNYIGGPEVFAAANRYTAGSIGYGGNFDANARLPKFLDNAGKMRRIAVEQLDLAIGDRSGSQESSSFDSIGNNSVRGSL